MTESGRPVVKYASTQWWIAADGAKVLVRHQGVAVQFKKRLGSHLLAGPEAEADSRASLRQSCGYNAVITSGSGRIS